MLINGVPGSSISIRDRGLLYGDGVFRTLRIEQGKASHWPLHYLKLQHDCNALGIACPDVATLSAELDVLLERYSAGVVKIIVTRGAGTRGYSPSAHASPTRIWDVSPLPAYPADHATKGIKAGICRLRLSHQPLLGGVKHLNRLENVLASAELQGTELAEGVSLDTADNVIEGTRSNLFLMSRGELITPDLSNCGVAGVQRDRVMAWAAHHNIPLNIREVKLDEAMDADELFVVNSIIGLWPIRELGQRRWTDFPVATRIRNHLETTGS
ncbi:MAG: aminodeoxychorismate lyase [Nitrosomonadales bacterium]|nr:aminodeoxychorismate lyase [Nitrosomonadales bacterium]